MKTTLTICLFSGLLAACGGTPDAWTDENAELPADEPLADLPEAENTVGVAHQAVTDLPTGATGKTVDELEDDGFTCEVVVAGFTECTKGRVRYYCSGGTCVLLQSASSQRELPEFELAPR